MPKFQSKAEIEHDRLEMVAFLRRQQLRATQGARGSAGEQREATAEREARVVRVMMYEGSKTL